MYEAKSVFEAARTHLIPNFTVEEMFFARIQRNTSNTVYLVKVPAFSEFQAHVRQAATLVG
jgi:hypothetical protein